MGIQSGRRRPRGSAPEIDIYRKRAAALRRAVKRNNCDALLITNSRDICYLTPFSGDDSVALLTARRLYIISDFRFEEALAPTRPLATIVIRSGSMAGAIAALVKDVAPRRLAIQSEHMSVATRADLASRLGERRLVNTTGLLRELRMIKDDAEVALIRRALRIQEAALLEVLPTIRPGQTELAIAARLESAMKSRGSSEPSFSTIVASGRAGSLPHAVPGRARTARGRPLLIDWGARFEGYVSDLTRTFSLGSWPRELRRVYEIVLQAQLAAIDAVKPGKSCAEVDAVARSIIADAGYGPRFGHALGHGIGLDVHEAPRVGKEIDMPLRAGMVVTIEPGIYLPGVGGVRIEDDILVTPNGRTVLSSLPKNIDWATL